MHPPFFIVIVIFHHPHYPISRPLSVPFLFHITRKRISQSSWLHHFKSSSRMVILSIIISRSSTASLITRTRPSKSTSHSTLDSWSISLSGWVDFVFCICVFLRVCFGWIHGLFPRQGGLCFVIVSICLYLHLSGSSNMHNVYYFYSLYTSSWAGVYFVLKSNCSFVLLCINGIFPQPGGLPLYFVLGCKHFKLNLQRALPHPI